MSERELDKEWRVVGPPTITHRDKKSGNMFQWCNPAVTVKVKHDSVTCHCQVPECDLDFITKITTCILFYCVLICNLHKSLTHKSSRLNWCAYRWRYIPKGTFCESCKTSVLTQTHTHKDTVNMQSIVQYIAQKKW